VTEIALALLAGTVTVAAPCILPMLPILLASSIGHPSRARPVFFVLGFVTTFSAAALLLGRAVDASGASATAVRSAAIILLATFGVLMIWPAPLAYVTARLGRVFTRANAFGNAAGSGNLGGFVLGSTIGVLWTPCAGPMLGSILTLVATAQDPTHAATLLVAYAVGAGLPMLAIAYGGQGVARNTRRLAPFTHSIQQAFGVVVIATALIMHQQWDTVLSANLSALFAGADAATRASVLDDHGPAPELAGIETWLNSAPLTIRSLRGKVVLVDFWTFGCGNCVATLPYVSAWYDRYKDRGLVVLGVHTPEFPFERPTASVRAALERFGIAYPVAQDNAYGTWKAYDNHHWPAQYLVDRHGTIVLKHFGEGHYDEMETAIRTLLG
jgi:cytochrome c biogenesis protein CcdA/thiol-disulfide isomerase/thioredoxin